MAVTSEARASTCDAAAVGGFAFQKELGAIHLSSGGAVFNTLHGTTNAVVIQHVLEFENRHGGSIRRLSMAADYLGIKGRQL
jgi:alcohol dehydrogenase class IV